jgi:hypothetical protein
MFSSQFTIAPAGSREFASETSQRAAYKQPLSAAPAAAAPHTDFVSQFSLASEPGRPFGQTTHNSTFTVPPKAQTADPKDDEDEKYPWRAYQRANNKAPAPKAAAPTV